MKRIELLPFVRNYTQLDNLEGFEYILAAGENHDNILAELKPLEKARNSNKKYTEFIEKSRELLMEYAEKDDNGNVIEVQNGVKLIPSKIEEYKEKAEALEKEYKADIEKQKKYDEGFNKELEKEISFELEMIDRKDVPKNITQGQYRLIKFMINKPTKNIKENKKKDIKDK